MLRWLLALGSFSMSQRRGAKRSRRGARKAPTIVLDPDGSTKCQICHLSATNDLFTFACGHDFCMNCIGRYFHSLVSKLQLIVCPVDGCSHEASTYELKKVAGEEAVERYKTNLIMTVNDFYHQVEPQAPSTCKNCLSTSIVSVEQIHGMPHKEVQAALQVKGLKKTRSKTQGASALVDYLDKFSQRWTCTRCNTYEEKPEAATGDGGVQAWKFSPAYHLYAALMNLEETCKQNTSHTARKQDKSRTTSKSAAAVSDENRVWASGTGFGGNAVEGDFMKAARKTSSETFKLVDKVIDAATKSLESTSSLGISIATVLGAGSLENVLDYLLGSSLLDIHIARKETSYLGVFKLLNLMASFPELRPNEAVINKLEKLVAQVNIGGQGGESSDTALSQELKSCYDKLKTQRRRNSGEGEEILEISAKSIYVEKLKPGQFRLVSGDATFSHYYRESDTSGADHKRMLRIQKEVASLAVSLPLMWESSIHVCINEDNMSFIKALITGPADTPYQNGVFLFDIYLPPAYPNSPPKVQFLTTGGGTVRFNPNLYANGYVCLSLLGTWSNGPSWIAGESTLLQVLVSIQSLIFVKDPFYNEPGHERYGKTAAAEAENKRHRANTLAVAILGAMKKPDPAFQDIILEHFKWKKLEIEQQCDEWLELDPSVSATVQDIKQQLGAVQFVRGSVTPTIPAPV